MLADRVHQRHIQHTDQDLPHRLPRQLHQLPQKKGYGQRHNQRAHHLLEHHHQKIALAAVPHDTLEKYKERHARTVVKKRFALDNGCHILGQSQLVQDAGGRYGICGGHNTSQQDAQPYIHRHLKQPGRPPE